jgi:hypothetical protein
MVSDFHGFMTEPKLSEWPTYEVPSASSGGEDVVCTSSHTRVPIEGRVEKPTHVVTTSPVTQSRITSPSRAQALRFVLSRPPTSPFLGVSRGLLSLEQSSCPQSASYAPIHSTSVCLVGLHRGFDQCPAFRTGPSCSTSLLTMALLRCPCQSLTCDCTPDTSGRPRRNVPAICDPSS